MGRSFEGTKTDSANTFLYNKVHIYIIYSRNIVYFFGIPSLGFAVVGEFFEKSVDTSVAGVVGLVVFMLSMSELVESMADALVVSALICKYYVISLYY